MNRFTSVEDALRDAHRAVDPVTGSLRHAPPNFDPRVLEHVDWSISASVERIVQRLIAEVVGAGASIHDACVRVCTAIEKHPIVAPRDDASFS